MRDLIEVWPCVSRGHGSSLPRQHLAAGGPDHRRSTAGRITPPAPPQDWEWPGGETPNPFSPADLEPAPEETMLERFLVRHGRVVHTQPHDPEDQLDADAQQGLQEGYQPPPGGEGVVGPGGTKRGRSAAGSEGAGPSGSAAGGEVAEDVPAPPPAKKVRLAGRAAAAAAAAGRLSLWGPVCDAWEACHAVHVVMAAPRRGTAAVP